jgi:hypothetical protein
MAIQDNLEARPGRDFDRVAPHEFGEQVSLPID